MQFDFSHQEQHGMVHAGKSPDGGDEWHCPICGRSIVIHWPPNYRMIVLHAGDETAMHAGGKGGLSIGAIEVQPATLDLQDDPRVAPPDIAQDAPKDAPRLAQWDDWLDQAGFDQWWERDL